jgi:uncharacterized glyoxalase superfamily protein PhnB
MSTPMHSTTVPLLRYRNANQAIDWLCRAFGFEVFLKVPGEDELIEHARLTLDANMIMLASIGRPGEDYFQSPLEAGGITQALILVVSNPSIIYRSACAAGAKIMTELADTPFGGAMFSCQDIESHVWVFGNQDPWQKTW